MSDDIRNKIELLETHKRRLNILKLRSAQLGLAADPSLTIEIEDISTIISNLELEIIGLKENFKKITRISTDKRCIITSNNSIENDVLVDRLHLFIQKCQENKNSASLIFFDVDRLDGINRAFGNQVGDIVTSIIESIVIETHANDFNARWAGDEFIIGIEGIEPTTTRQYADKLRNRISKYTWNSVAENLYVTASFGISSFKDHESITDWLVRTIIGCKKAKIKQNKVCFAPEIISRTSSRNLLDYISRHC